CEISLLTTHNSGLTSNFGTASKRRVATASARPPSLSEIIPSNQRRVKKPLTSPARRFNVSPHSPKSSGLEEVTPGGYMFLHRRRQTAATTLMVCFLV